MIFDGRGKPPQPRERPKPAQWGDEAITGSCLGHATVFLKFLGVRVLTDQVFSERCGPGISPFLLGPKRYLDPCAQCRRSAYLFDNLRGQPSLYLVFVRGGALRAFCEL